jgi:branched-chain amino acid transport system permease protein
MEMLLQTVINGLLLGGIYVVVAIGLSLIFGVTHEINLAHGEFVMLGGFTGYWLYVFFKINPYLSCIIIFFLFGAIGYVLQKHVINRVVEAPLIISLVLLFGISLFFRNAALYVWSADRRSVSTAISGKYLTFFGANVSVSRIIALGIGIICVIGLFIFLHKTKTGKAIQATAQDSEAAKLLGIETLRIYNLAFAIGIGLTALAGGLLASIISIHPTMGVSYTLYAFFVVVIGGLGYMPGTLVGGLTLGLMQSFITIYVGAQFTFLLSFLGLYIILVLRPRGIFGKGTV